jgi:hypothetical protein
MIWAWISFALHLLGFAVNIALPLSWLWITQGHAFETTQEITPRSEQYAQQTDWRR